MSAHGIDQSSESVKRVSQASPTDGRTDRRTKNLQDTEISLTSLDAHENSAGIDVEVARIGTTLRAVTEQIAQAGQRLPVVRTTDHRELDPRIRKMVLLRDGYSCQWCKRNIREDTAFQIDHIHPWSTGGTNATDNLRTLCVDCNQSRSNFRTDSETATALLIVGSCPWCRGRHYVPAWESEDGHSSYVYDEDAAMEVSIADRDVPVWCITCRTTSSTNVAHANRVRDKQAELASGDSL